MQNKPRGNRRGIVDEVVLHRTEPPEPSKLKGKRYARAYVISLCLVLHERVQCMKRCALLGNL